MLQANSPYAQRPPIMPPAGIAVPQKPYPYNPPQGEQIPMQNPQQPNGFGAGSFMPGAQGGMPGGAQRPVGGPGGGMPHWMNRFWLSRSTKPSPFGPLGQFGMFGQQSMQQPMMGGMPPQQYGYNGQRPQGGPGNNPYLPMYTS